MGRERGSSLLRRHFVDSVFDVLMKVFLLAVCDDIVVVGAAVV